MESTSFFIALMIHLFGLILGLGSVVVTDLFGLLWILNHVRFPQIIRISAKTEKFIWAGWLIMVAAGIPLIYIKGVIDNLMIIKLFFVGIIAVNGIFLHWIHQKLKCFGHKDQVPKLLMFRLILAIFVSQLGWWTAFVIGFLHRHVQTVINWPNYPYWVCLGILTVLLIVWGFGEKIIKNYDIRNKS
jgi:hypothetical protein